MSFQKINDNFIMIGHNRIRISAINSYSYNFAQPKSRYLTIIVGSSKIEILLEIGEVEACINFLDKLFGTRKLSEEFLD